MATLQAPLPDGDLSSERKYICQYVSSNMFRFLISLAMVWSWDISAYRSFHLQSPCDTPPWNDPSAGIRSARVAPGTFGVHDNVDTGRQDAPSC
jgi:hypothetical protein